MEVDSALANERKERSLSLFSALFSLFGRTFNFEFSSRSSSPGRDKKSAPKLDTQFDSQHDFLDALSPSFFICSFQTRGREKSRLRTGKVGRPPFSTSIAQRLTAVRADLALNDLILSLSCYLLQGGGSGWGWS